MSYFDFSTLKNIVRISQSCVSCLSFELQKKVSVSLFEFTKNLRYIDTFCVPVLCSSVIVFCLRSLLALL